MFSFYFLGGTDYPLFCLGLVWTTLSPTVRRKRRKGSPPPLIFLKIFGKGTGGPVRDAVGGGDGMFQAKTAVGLQGEL